MLSDRMMETLRRYAVVSPDDKEGLRVLQDCAEAAEAYLTGAGAPQNEEDPLWGLALRRLAVYWKETAGPHPQYGYPDPPPDLNALIISLRSGRTEVSAP